MAAASSASRSAASPAVSADGMAQPLCSSWNSAHQPSRIDRLSEPLRAAFMPEVPHASSGRSGLLSHTSVPGYSICAMPMS